MSAMSLSELFAQYAREIGMISATAATSILATHWWRNHKSNQALASGILGGHDCVYAETLYIPAGEINPETGEEFYDQWLRTIGKNINLGDIFDSKVSRAVLKYIDKAAKKCTPEEPIVFQHLEKVIPKKHRDRIMDLISRNWKSYFGPMMKEDKKPTSAKISGRQKPVEGSGIPVLVFEPNNRDKIYRILYIDSKSLEGGSLPASANIRNEGPGGVYSHDPKHNHAQRLRTNEAIITALKSDQSLIDKFRVNFPTGEVRKVSAPLIPGP